MHHILISSRFILFISSFFFLSFLYVGLFIFLFLVFLLHFWIVCCLDHCFYSEAFSSVFFFFISLLLLCVYVVSLAEHCLCHIFCFSICSFMVRRSNKRKILGRNSVLFAICMSADCASDECISQQQNNKVICGKSRS